MPSLTPDQLSAREFLVHISRGDLMSLYLQSELADIMSRYPDEDDVDDMMNEVHGRLHQLAYSTTLDDAFAEFDAAKDDERGLWAGRYALFDDGGGDYVLHLRDDGASLVTPDGTLTEHAFSGGTLKIGDAQYAFELRMILPLTDAQMDHPDFDLAAPTTPGQPRCEGTVTIRSDGKTQTRKVQGKRGCFTRAGVERAVDGDPSSQWNGVYRLIYTDQDPWTRLPDALSVSASGESLAIALGAQQGTEVRFANNALHCLLDAQGKTQLTGYFILTPGSNLRRFFGLLDTDGVARSVTGYWTQERLMAAPVAVPKPAPKPAPRAALARRAMVAGDPPAEARRFPIDLASLPATGTSTTDKDDKGVDLPAYDLYEFGEHGNGIVLPKGVERNDYAIILDFKNMPSSPGFTATGVWKMVGASDTAALFVKLRRSSGNVPWLDASMGETQSAGWHYFGLEQVIAAVPGVPAVLDKDGKVVTAAVAAVPAKVCRIWMDLEGVSRNPIEIAPTELDPIIINKKYDSGVTAAGGEPPLRWTRSGVLPPGISFDPATRLFSGTVTDTSLALRVYPIMLEAKSDDRVVMSSGTAAINLRIETELSSADQHSLTAGQQGLWAGIGSALFGVLITVAVPLVQFLRRGYTAGGRYKSAQKLIREVRSHPISIAELKRAMVDKYSEADKKQTGIADAKQAIVDFRNEIEVRKVEQRGRIADIEKLIDAGVSADDKVKLEREIERLKADVKEAARAADAMDTAVDSFDKSNERENADFEKHIKGV